MTARFLLLAIFFGSALLHAAEYRFTMEGKNFEPSILPVMGARKGAFAEGDIGHTHDFPFVLGKPGHYQFRVGGAEDTKLFCKVDDRAEHCVSIILKRIDPPAPFQEAAPVIINPLEKMTPADRTHLRGVHLVGSSLSPKLAELMDGIDWNTTVLSINCSTGNPLPALPDSLRYLEISSEDARSLSALKFRNLRYLKMHAVAHLDLTVLAVANELRNIDLEFGSVKNVDALANLSELRFLKIRHVQGLKNVGFVHGLPLLRVFKIDLSDVTDLRPVEACPDLRLLSASGAKINNLPDPSKLPKLRDFRLLSTPVAGNKDLIAAFRRASPICTVHVDWRKALLAKLGTIDRVLIHGQELPPPPQPRIEIQDPGKIASLLQGIAVHQRPFGPNCLCAGNPWVEFYRGKKLIATIGYHHSQVIRWHKGLWPSDARITPECAKQLCDFMVAEGLHTPRKNLREQQSGKGTELIPAR